MPSTIRYYTTCLKKRQWFCAIFPIHPQIFGNSLKEFLICPHAFGQCIEGAKKKNQINHNYMHKKTKLFIINHQPHFPTKTEKTRCFFISACFLLPFSPDFAIFLSESKPSEALRRYLALPLQTRSFVIQYRCKINTDTKKNRQPLRSVFYRESV